MDRLYVRRVCEAAPRPSLFRGVRQFVRNHLESVSCHFAEQLQPLSTKHSRVVTRQFSKKTKTSSTSRPPERSSLGAYQVSGVAPANQTKERAKTKSSWISPIFLCEFWCFSLGKQARNSHIELLFRNAPAKSSWTDFFFFWFAGALLIWEGLWKTSENHWKPCENF